MVRLVGYARVSTQSQAENTSLAEQERLVKEYCQAMGYELVGFFQDVRSGKLKERDGLKEALDMVRDCDGLIAAKIDRVGRDAINLLALEKDLREAGKVLVVTSLNIDTTTPLGRAMFGIASVMAQLDCETINERMSNGKEAVKRAGGNIGGAPALGKKASDKKHSPYEDAPEELEIIKIIKNHRRAGKGLSEIARYLNENGVLTKRGKQWHPAGVKNVLDRQKAKAK